MDDRITEFANGPYTFDVLDDGPVAGAPVILLHGFPQRATAWELVAPRLHANGLRTLAPDLRGYSPRARPSARRDYRMSEIVGDVIALIDTLGADTVDLVGHDWGGMAAWAVAARRPERIATLTVASTPHPSAFVRAMPRGQVLRSWYMAAFNIPKVPEWFLTRMFRSADGGARMGLPEPFASRVRADIVDSGALPGALNWYRGMPFWNRADRRTGRVRVPTTYVWGDGDFALGRAAAEMTSGYVDAPYEFRILHDADHWLPEARPDELAAAIVDRVTA
ncbi:alpha/beta fold hydrolase [Gordonia sp. HNM0687]|uniref:Alpha/beta fold hydrolase n=1 Tax=Gordonia mangrovi TaxID=2665643 RepID=A0A6L7GNP9_9ACTN|nr:alpha/beta fold hydrolase [Gordonia mangrovi]MXP21496.1 alpha/beta fold hydrolase [Gordonia mangrovi]UVF80242.1 alpha/beta fold hydrolase [Gordonia mangrovi]